MRFLDKSFSKNKGKYLLQSFLASLMILIIIYFANYFKNYTIISSLGATSFIVFVLPHYRLSKPRLVLGGYLVSLLVGVGCFYLLLYSSSFFQSHHILKSLFASFAVGVAIFIMVIFDYEHPPAAGLALGIILSEWSLAALFYLLFSVSLMLIIKHIFRRWMIDLI